MKSKSFVKHLLKRKRAGPRKARPCGVARVVLRSDYAATMRPEDVDCAHVRAGGGRRTRAVISLHVNDVRLA